jgi:hypothetical protein
VVVAAPYLVAEDVVLLALDPTTGRPVDRLWPELFGGCLLADLALDGAVSVDPGGLFRFPEVTATPTVPRDPLLVAAATRLGDRSSRAEDAGRALGTDAHQALLDRLVHRGVLEQREERSKILSVCITACGTNDRGDLDLPWDPGGWFD